ncbi:hypothetical protein BDZ89DRAFT_1159175 [Hymenopellis radicata]|nr:hypothetical protein BDZ89DRAFT_1159175 [Hymenopellis radicata]
MQPPLPQELIDIIIDESCLSGDIHDLNSLSQVSRAFLPRTRDHLFRQVRITSRRQCCRFRAICCSSPRVAHHVKTLTLNFFYYNKLNQSAELADILARLSDLDNIVIEGFKWGALLDRSQKALLAHPFQSITLCDASFPDLHALCAFIDASPGLKSLSMSSIGIVDEREREHVHEPVEISVLSVGGRQDVIYDAMILHACPVSLNRLRSAVLVLESPHDFHVMKDILRAASCFLEELTVLHRPFEDGPLVDSTDLPERIDIPHVHAIKLALWDHHSARAEGDTVDAVTLEWWINKLQSCDELERLQIQLFLRSDAIFRATYDFSIWSSLDVCLSRLPYFRRLTCIVNMSWPLAPSHGVGRLYMDAIEKEFRDLKKYRLFDIDVHGGWRQGKDCTC